MRNIAVVATASRSGGALTIYRQFISHLRENIGEDRYYIFVDSTMPIEEIDGVQYIQYPTISHLSRIKFDRDGCKRVLEGMGVNPDVVISFQNTGIHSYKSKKQIIYYHQSLPFYDFKWNVFKSQERTNFFYKNVYPWFVSASINDATEVVVQTQFVKDNFVKKYNHPTDKVHVMMPDIEKIDVEVIQPYEFKSGKYHLIYPAAPYPYKRHDTIIRAVSDMLKRWPEMAEGLKVHFTFNHGDNETIDKLVIEYGLQDIFVYEGVVNHDELLRMYKASTALLFPSEIETLGLPLLEAAAFGLPIIVNDTPYAYDVMKGYTNHIYVNISDCGIFAEEIKNVITSRSKVQPYAPSNESSWNKFFKLI